MTTLNSFAENFILLIFLVFVYSKIFRYFYNLKFIRSAISGFLFGFICIALMLHPLYFMPGLFFDTRSVVISAAGVFCGIPAAAVCCTIAAIFRFYQGGIGAATGIAVILSSGLLGVGYYYLLKKHPDALKKRYIFMFGIIVHIAMLLCMFLMPLDIALKTIKEFGLWIIIAYPLLSLVVIVLLKDVRNRLKMEKALEESSKNYNQLVNESNSIMLRIAPDLTILFANEYALDFFGFKQEELVGKNVIGTIVPEIDSQGLNLSDKLGKIVKNPNEYQHNANENMRKDGSRCWMTWSNKPIYDKAGNVAETVCVGLDITDIKKLKDKLSNKNKELRKLNVRLELATDSAGIGIWELNLKNNSIIWDKNMYSSYGIKENNVQNKYEVWRNSVHPDDLETAERALQKAIINHEIFEQEFRIIRPDGDIRFLKVFGALTYDVDGTPDRMIGVNYDISELKNTQVKLTQQMNEYNLLFNNMSLGFAEHQMLYDESGFPVDYRFIKVNPAFEKMTGLSADKIINRTVKEIFPKTESYWIENYGAVAKTGKSIVLRNYSVELDKYFEVFAFSTKEDRFAVIVSDVSNEEKQKNQRRFANDILSSLNNIESGKDIISNLVDLFKDFSGADGVGIRLREGEDFPYYITKGFSEEFIESEKYLCTRKADGSICHDSNGTPIFECLCGAVISRTIDCKLDCITQNGSFWTNSTTLLNKKHKLCMRSRNKCNQAGYESLALVPIKKNEEIIGIVQFNYFKPGQLSLDFIEFMESICHTVGIAITRIKNYEAIIQSRKQAELANNAKNEFLAMVFHEIRTPLNGIIGFSDIVRDQVIDCKCGNKNETLKSLDIIQRCGNSLTDIIEDIIEITHIETGNIKIISEEFTPEDLLKESIEIFRAKAEEKKLEIKLSCSNLPKRVIGAAKRLRQVVFNLVGNAIKFTDKGKVEIYAEWQHNKLQINIKDSGIGIPQDMQEKILEPFYQIHHGNTRKYGGTGLGLTIVSRILKELGESFKIESTPGIGTTISFSYSLKVLDPAIGAEKSLISENYETSSMYSRIIVVENDEASSSYLDIILSKMNGVEYKMAESFSEMKKICDSGFLPDIALLDISLSDASGYDCLKWLREKFSDKKITFIAQTAHVIEKEIEKQKKAGFDGFIDKPYRKQELIDLISSMGETL